MNKDPIKEELDKVKAEDGAVDQLSALVKITSRIISNRSKENLRIWIALLVSILVNLILVFSFLWYESQWETTYTTETITTTEQSVEGDSAEINNVDGDMYKDNSVHNEGGE